MTKPLTVRDRNGNIVERADGVMRDGDQLQAIRVPLALQDAGIFSSEPGPGRLYVKDGAQASAATLASAATILGDKFDEAAIAKLSDTAARHAVVRKRIGADANGRSAAYLDAAWGALAGTGSPQPAVAQPASGSPPMPVLTDAQRAHAAAAVERALSDVATPAQQRRGGMLTDAERLAGNDRIQGAYRAMCADMSDAWKPQARRDAETQTVTLDPRVEAAFRDGRIAATPNARAYEEMKQRMSDGWKEGRK